MLFNPITDVRLAIASVPAHYARDVSWALGGANTTLLSPNTLTVNINNQGYLLPAQASIDLNNSASWDSISPTDYAVAANRAGKDFYIYACQPGSGNSPTFVLSANSTVPTGYTSSNSRKIGGFHCLCLSVGAVAGHPLTGFLTGDILPASIWDLAFRPVSNPEGMVYSAATGIWVDIYLTSGTGPSTASVFGATISDTRDWNSFVDDGGAVRKRLLKDFEFQVIAAGSNEQTNILGSVDPNNTGGHSDTAGRRMVSNIGCEDCAGAMWQWLDEQSYQLSSLAHTHTENTAAAYTQNAVTGSADPSPAWGWYALPGGKGQLYRQGTYGDTKLLAGARWDDGANSGSRSRIASYYRWRAGSNVGGRFGARSQ